MRPFRRTRSDPPRHTRTLWRICGGGATGLSLSHGHGNADLSDIFQSELRFLGIQSSPALARELEGNRCAGGFTQTLKKNLGWIHSFDTIEKLRQVLVALKDLCNPVGWSNGLGSVRPLNADQPS